MNRIKFAKEFSGLCEVFKREPTKTLTDVYFRVLQDLTDEQFSQAVAHVLSDRKYTSLPLPAEFLTFVFGNPEEKALVALEKVERAIREAGAYSSVQFDDPIIHRIIDGNADGWPGICSMTNDEWKWYRKDFLKMYQAFSNDRNQPNIPVVLLGIHDHHNIAGGHYVEPQYLKPQGDVKQIESWTSKQKRLNAGQEKIKAIVGEVLDGKNHKRGA